MKKAILALLPLFALQPALAQPQVPTETISSPAKQLPANKAEKKKEKAEKKEESKKSNRVVQSKDTRASLRKTKKDNPLAGKDAALPDKQLYDKAVDATKDAADKAADAVKDAAKDAVKDAAPAPAPAPAPRAPRRRSPPPVPRTRRCRPGAGAPGFRPCARAAPRGWRGR